MGHYEYQKVAADIRTKVSVGDYTPGMRLPTTDQLCRQYGVSKITIKRAMDELAAADIVYRRRGSGTYVKRTPALREGLPGACEPTELKGFSAEHEALGEQVSARVREFSVVRPTDDVARKLALDSEAFCYRFSRTCYAGGRPLMDETAYLPLEIFPGLHERHVAGSLFGYVEHDLGLRIASSHRCTTAEHPSPQTAQRLGILTSDPVLVVVQVSFLADGRPFELSRTLNAPGHELYSRVDYPTG